MTARLFHDLNAYGDDCVWLDNGTDFPDLVLTRYALVGDGADALWERITATCDPAPVRA